MQLTPAGEFRGLDGRPGDAPAWIMDAQAANDVIAFCSARKTPFVIDYEHQTLFKEQNGQPAPAAGWFTGAALSFREGEGLFAKVELTERAKEYIASGEYKFVSPVMLYKKGTGRIIGLQSAALTNTPAIDGMDELIARAAASFTLDDSISQESLSMDIDDLLEQLRWLLNLPTMATAEEVTAELEKAVAAIKSSNATETAAANFRIDGLVTSQVAALSQARTDLKAATDKLAALGQEKSDAEVNGIVEAALTAGKLLPAQKDAAIDLGKANLAALSKMLDGASAIAALTDTQTKGQKPEGATDVTDSVALAAAAQKFMADESAAGRVVSSAVAVAHVKSQAQSK